jgi:hypothetical protein
MWAADSSPEELPAAASLAQAYYSDALWHVAGPVVSVESNGEAIG